MISYRLVKYFATEIIKEKKIYYAIAFVLALCISIKSILTGSTFNIKLDSVDSSNSISLSYYFDYILLTIFYIGYVFLNIGYNCSIVKKEIEDNSLSLIRLQIPLNKLIINRALANSFVLALLFTSSILVYDILFKVFDLNYRILLPLLLFTILNNFFWNYLGAILTIFNKSLSAPSLIIINILIYIYSLIFQTRDFSSNILDLSLNSLGSTIHFIIFDSFTKGNILISTSIILSFVVIIFYSFRKILERQEF